MILGVCWPTPGPEPQPLPESHLGLLRLHTGATHLRLDLHHDQPAVGQMVGAARAAGFEVLPILDFDYASPDLARYASFCGEAVRRHRFPAVELGNEPHLLHRMPAARYAEAFRAGAEAVRATGVPTQVYIAGEITRPIGEPIGYFREVRALVPEDLYDVVAIHPYRNPRPPSFAPFGSRAAELRHYQAAVPQGKGIAVTEVGWDLRDGVSEGRQAAYLGEELEVWSELGVDAVYVYQHIDPPGGGGFGLFTAGWEPRPAAAALAEFQRRVCYTSR